MALGRWRYATRLAVLVPTALIAGWMWITRQEGPWILPAFAVLALGIWLRERDGAGGMRYSRLRATMLVLVPVLGVIAVYSSLLEMNERRYGARVFVEDASPEYRAAMGAIMRVEPDERRQYEPITVADFDRLCSVSPNAREARSRVSRAGIRSGMDGLHREWRSHHERGVVPPATHRGVTWVLPRPGNRRALLAGDRRRDQRRL